MLTSINTVMFVAGATEPRSRRDDESMSRHRRGRATKRWARHAATLREEGVVSDLLVARRRRCPDIDSFSLLDLASQAPSANITVFMEGST